MLATKYRREEFVKIKKGLEGLEGLEGLGGLGGLGNLAQSFHL